ncbi:bifunctional cysteine desulfurase/selenocysteine lyase [Corynebacterium occultum]|uniref:Bifunctional cysteine desulfurase/selenocysteine lyase n=1 Tax=Corynebacterium occultum TaxID=2675219 RepID=A0A6B8W2F9_9CORY|nr:aminotransferase class V-fold PLP-dependent enzyme [Corynebacterium occultum]QGU06207.1 bifunctional cysteine desulfurase/selenocysteine lyase [Corynebacterium occultum]
MAYDVARVRGLYVSLSDGWTYLNAHACPQIPERVSAAVARSFRLSPGLADSEPTSGTHSRAGRVGRLEGEHYLDAARLSVADLVGAAPEQVVLGPSLPVLYHSLARAMRPLLRHNSSIVLSRLDQAVLTAAFEGLNAGVRWAQPDLATGALPGFQYADLVDGSTRLVALSHAHELLGTVAPVAEICEIVRDRSRAWVLVDATAVAPYRPLSAAELGADILGLDLAALGGPQLAALVFRDSRMFRRLDSLNPHAAGDSAAKLESPISTGLAGGVAATVDHLADLVISRGTRSTRLQHSMRELEDYLEHLAADLQMSLGNLASVHILGVTGEAANGGISDRIPRLSFAVRDVPAETVHQRLIDNGLVTTLCPTSPLLSEMGVEEIGGAVTVSLGPFNTSADVDNLVRVLASLA